MYSDDFRENYVITPKKGTDAGAKGFVLSAEGGMKWRNDSEKVEKERKVVT